MGKSTYIKLKKDSTQQQITLDEIKNLLHMYVERTAKTGDQVAWEYEDSSFPYTIQEKLEGQKKYLYLKGKNSLYNYLVMGTGSEEVDGETQNYIQIVLPDEDYITPGDMSKGNEFAKYLSKYLKGELHLFNGRVIYDYPRK